MVYGNIPPITYNYGGKTSNNVYSNPEYLRLMMTQASSNFDFVSGSDNNSTSGINDILGGSNTSLFDNILAQSTNASAISPQLQISIYGGLIGKEITAAFNNTVIKGKVSNVYLQGNTVMITIGGVTYPSDQLVLSKVE